MVSECFSVYFEYSPRSPSNKIIIKSLNDCILFICFYHLEKIYRLI